MATPLPATLDFPTFAASTQYFVRTPCNRGGLLPPFLRQRRPGADSGTRVLVNLTGYGSATRLFVPDAIVGNSGNVATTIGQFSGGVNGGTYAPGGNGQLLLVRVSGADANGAGGTPAFSKPVTTTSFSTVSEIAVLNGSASVTYEVVDANSQCAGIRSDSGLAVVAQTNCPTSLTPVLTFGC